MYEIQILLGYDMCLLHGNMLNSFNRVGMSPTFTIVNTEDINYKKASFRLSLLFFPMH